MAAPDCASADRCAPKTPQPYVLAEPVFSVTVPSMSVVEMTPAQAAILAQPSRYAAPRVLPEPVALASLEAEPKSAAGALAAIDPEPSAEPEPPPTVAAEPQRWVGRWRPVTVSFAYLNNHPVAPLAAADIEPAKPVEPWTDATNGAAMPLDAESAPRAISRLGICSAIVSAARGYDLPLPFFANLIWQESNFHLREVSGAGALGVAQFIPETANEHGLINPFEPIHAIHTSAKFLRRLLDQYHNLGFAAAAYNAGPGRVNEWLSKRRALPGETRAYVMSITGHRAREWAATSFRHDPESRLMPAKAPCAEVTADVEQTAKLVRVAKLMQELAGATQPPPKPAAPPADAMAKAGGKPGADKKLHTADAQAKTADKPAKLHSAKDQSKPEDAPTALEAVLRSAAEGATTSQPPKSSRSRPAEARAKGQVKDQAKTKIQANAKSAAKTLPGVQTQAKNQAAPHHDKPRAKVASTVASR